MNKRGNDGRLENETRLTGKVMKEPVPRERIETVRQEIIRLLEGRSLPVIVISKVVRKPEKEVFDHLDQIGRSGLLTIIPSQCCVCGFVYKHRKRAKKPGKCPQCRSTRITPPLFTVKRDPE